MGNRWATFDCYGTLVDWEAGITATFRRLWPEADARTLLAEYHRHEPAVQADRSPPYREVLAECLRRVAASHGFALDRSDEAALADALPAWPVFPEVAAALRTLREAGWSIAVLSNTDPDLLAASVEAIGVSVDEQITAADAGSYKPAPGHWKTFFERTRADRSRHVHVGASVFHDVEPCTKLGLRVVWINRTGEPAGPTPYAELPDLTPLPATLAAIP